jgi:hypothetical protein
MTDPGRLVDEGGLGADLLRAGRSLDAARARERKAALIGAAGATAAAITVKALPKGALHVLLGKWFLAGAIAVAVAVPAVRAISPAPPAAVERLPPAASAPAAEPTALPPAATTPAVEGTAPPPAASARVPEVKAARPAAPARHVEEAPSAHPVESAAPPDPPDAGPAASLAAEAAVLREARAALGAGQPARALALLEERDRGFPRGRLGIEAEVLHIEALALSGDAAAARARAQAFIAAHPDTPYAQRVRVHVDRSPP